MNSYSIDCDKLHHYADYIICLNNSWYLDCFDRELRQILPENEPVLFEKYCKTEIQKYNEYYPNIQCWIRHKFILCKSKISILKECKSYELLTKKLNHCGNWIENIPVDIIIELIEKLAISDNMKSTYLSMVSEIIDNPISSNILKQKSNFYTRNIYKIKKNNRYNKCKDIYENNTTGLYSNLYKDFHSGKIKQYSPRIVG